MLVVDASSIVALLVDSGPPGQFVAEAMPGQRLSAPHLMPVEVTSVLRRAVSRGGVSDDAALLALRDVDRLRVTYAEFAPFLMIRLRKTF